MDLPKSSNREKKKFWKICHESGCDTGFFGYAVAKYCIVHRDPKNRVRKRKREKFDKNMVFMHDFKEVILIEFCCQACNVTYRCKVLPKQYVYPKFCEKHRIIKKGEKL